jgi:uncharacterized membrane protein (UPF0127 family)
MAVMPLIVFGCDDQEATVDVEAGPGPPYTSTVIVGGDGAAGGVPLQVEIADTPEQRSRGLMGRESVPEDAGMLFVWTEDTESGFWMKDTLVPLSVAFVDAAGVIVDIQDMQPLDETLRHSAAPYRYAVEANQGWFAEHAVEVGDGVMLPDLALPTGS